ncbi:DsbE family thiol:disulfide interchange protein [Aeromonas simiae]|uniref:DsbE family thiol:disulfide interchange protein n=2 Tax=Aeromonas simiae TaxID=218936 RepID=UPI0005A8B194|nr:DsbE family thiol:disulfide interchange protein [Aeromonas simiae]MDO2947248.1 DsbE family thiol:disulfide interchange protein [Aeromonas simiae]MDO2950865.1 DsbE family thiol:disulfide interchange protein [Aeromonas simiae]MDO2954796.1 DsbE family thiol:disulfide interchange protein [Aeromonas simiae]
MSRKRWLFLIPFVVFMLGALFLFRGLYSDPRKLESVLVGKEVPVFTLQDIFDLSKQHDRSLLTGRPMLLNVWATWCPTCYSEHEYLKALASQGIAIIGMNYKDDRTKAIGWLKELGNPYQVTLYDPDGMLGLDLGVYGAPETFFIDSQGIIRYRHVGDINPQVWESSLKAIYEGMK